MNNIKLNNLIVVLSFFIKLSVLAQSPTDLIGKDSINHALLSELMIKSLNANRLKIGVQPLSPDSSAMSFAKRHCLWMVNKGLVHAEEEGFLDCIQECFISSLLTYQEAADLLIRKWMNSKPHKKVLMGAEHRKCGTFTAEYEKTQLVAGFCVRSNFTVIY